MKLFTSVGLLCGLSLLFVSCSNDDDQQEPTPAVNYPNYSQLKVGNYWIYQRFQIENGTATPLQIFDSVYVAKDSVIGGNTYYLLKRPVLFGIDQYKWLRDSLHYIVNRNGKIEFSSQNFQTILHQKYEIDTSTGDTTESVVGKMVDRDSNTQTPAGIFATSNYRETYLFNSPTTGNFQFNMHSRYAKQVGLVTETLIGYLFEFEMGRYVERRLVRFQVN